MKFTGYTEPCLNVERFQVDFSRTVFDGQLRRFIVRFLLYSFRVSSSHSFIVLQHASSCYTFSHRKCEDGTSSELLNASTDRRFDNVRKLLKERMI
jgi:hypothetical protein